MSPALTGGFFTPGPPGKPLECVLKGDSFKTLNGNQGRLPATCLVGPRPEASHGRVWVVIVPRSHGVASSLVAPCCWNQCPAQTRSSLGSDEERSAGMGPRVQRSRPPTRQSVAPLLSEHPPGACWARGHGRDGQATLPGSSRAPRPLLCLPRALGAPSNLGSVNSHLLTMPTVMLPTCTLRRLPAGGPAASESLLLRQVFRRRPAPTPRPLPPHRMTASPLPSSAFNRPPRSSVASPALTSPAGPDPPRLRTPEASGSPCAPGSQLRLPTAARRSSGCKREHAAGLLSTLWGPLLTQSRSRSPCKEAPGLRGPDWPLLTHCPGTVASFPVGQALSCPRAFAQGAVRNIRIYTQKHHCAEP